MSNNELKGKVKEANDIHYWRGFKDLYNDPAFAEEKKNEFTHGITEAPNLKSMSAISRRRFLALMGASAALAGVSCSPYRDKGKIIPYVNGKESLLPGIANYYASTYNNGGQSYGILIKTREGRPIKINGNPDHPLNKGKIPSHVQAAILDLYDPARFQYPQRQKKSDLALFKNVYEKTSWKEIDSELIKLFEKAVADKKEIAVIGHTNLSPTAQKIYDDFTKVYPTAKFYHYELFDDQNRKDAWNRCYGTTKLPLLHFNKANVIISIDGDFLGTDRNSTSYIPEFSQRRDIVKNAKFNRFYMVEAGYSQSSLNADYRLKLKPELYENFLISLLNTVAEKIDKKLPREISNLTDKSSLNDFTKTAGWDEQVVIQMVEDILKEKQNVLFYAGDQQSVNVHLLVNTLNDILGSTTHYEYTRQFLEFSKNSNFKNLLGLSNKMMRGEVAAVIHLDTNPVYHLPPDLKYAEGLEKVENVISMAHMENETVLKSHFVLPIHHPLESWGDAAPLTGVYSLQQPVIEPLYDSRQSEAIFMIWNGKDVEKYSSKIYHDYLRDNWQTSVYPGQKRVVDFKQFWFASLHDGVAYVQDKNVKVAAFNSSALSGIEVKKSNNAWTLIFKPSYTLGDGKYANNGWMQEIPHPVTKVTWDNYAAISVASSEKLHVKNNDLLEIEFNGKKIKMPAFIQPGMADDTIAMEMGYGRKSAGPVGSNVGFDINRLRTLENGPTPWLLYDAKVLKTDGKYELASTQEHFVIDLEEKAELLKERHIVDVETLEEYQKNPNVTKDKRDHVFSITDDWEYKGNKWGMAIDLNKCIGCNDCVTSCNVENNIPVVGKDQVMRGREMHWMRIDRYYSGTPEEPNAILQPMLCQHCDNAPCENVCPVAATVHSPEGLNDMAYNRCVGTRYCANNCPYKVRRFNFFNYRDHVANGYYESDSLTLLANPEVTVRSRGVMEKCSMCVQRISQEKDMARKERRDPDGDKIVTACQEACPADAIVFGDSNKKDGALSKYLQHELSFYALEETNVRPNITYITKLRNTHTEDQA